MNNALKITYDKYYSQDINGAIEWCYGMYMRDFIETFNEVNKLYNRLSNQYRIISDEELEWIMIELPLRLFDIAEALNNLRLGEQVIKLRNKELKHQFKSEFKEKVVVNDPSFSELTKSELNEAMNAYVESQLTECNIVLAVHSATVNRVDNQISFCKELIMGAKKVWDSRRNAENVNPISEVDTDKYDLPDYEIGRM